MTIACKKPKTLAELTTLAETPQPPVARVMPTARHEKFQQRMERLGLFFVIMLYIVLTVCADIADLLGYDLALGILALLPIMSGWHRSGDVLG